MSTTASSDSRGRIWLSALAGPGAAVAGTLGIVLVCLLAVRLGVARLPDGVGWSHMAGAGAVAGIGFTVSLFIAGLSFPGAPDLTAEATVGILAGSVLAAVLGTLLLRFSGRR